MLSRRSFLFASLGSLVTVGELTNPSSQAWAKKTPRTPTLTGPHSLSREDWAPAIMPDHVGVVGNGYLCFTDDYGRLAIVDLRRAGVDKSSIKIIGELSGIGTKVIDFAFSSTAAYGLVYRENENQEPVVWLVNISLASSANPTIVSTTMINRFVEGTAITFANDLLCISGISSSGENIASIYSTNKHGGEPNYLASLTMQNPVRRVDLQDRQLVILTSANGGNSQLDVVELSNPTAPSIRNTFTIGGDCRVMSRFKDVVIVVGNDTSPSSSRGCQARAIGLNTNGQGVVPLALPELTSVISASVSPKGDQYIVLGENTGERAVMLLNCDRNHNLSKGQQLKLPGAKGESNSKGTVVMKDTVAYVAAGWSGVTMLNRGKDGLTLGSTYSIPRLSAAGVASWGDMVVLAGAQLQLYSIAKPERPSLINWADPENAIRSIVGAGSFVLCLGRDEIALRKMDRLREVAATVKVQASQICFDNSQKTAFCIKALDKTTRITKIKVYSNSMSAEAPFEVPGVFNRCQASNGALLLSGLSDIALYRTATGAAAVATEAANAVAAAVADSVSKAAASSAKSSIATSTAASIAKNNGKAGAKSDTKSDTKAESKTPVITAAMAGLELVGTHHVDNLAVRDVAIGEDVIIASAIDQNRQGFFLVLDRTDKDMHVLGSINLPSDGVALAVSGSKAVAVGRNLEGKDVASVVTFANKINPQILTTLSVIEGVSSVTIKDQMAVLAGRGLEIVTLG